MSNIRSPRVFHVCALERLQMLKRVQRGGNIRCLLRKLGSLSRQMALLFSLCAMTGIWSFTLRSKGEPINVSPLWRSKWYTSCSDPHNRWFSWQTSVCGCKTITCSTPPMRNWGKVRQMVNTPQLYFQMCWKSALFPNKVFITFALGYSPWHESHTILNHFQFTSEFIT